MRPVMGVRNLLGSGISDFNSDFNSDFGNFDTFHSEPVSAGGFTKGFSVGFDIKQNNNAAFNPEAFSSGFATQRSGKGFNSAAFSSGFAKDNR